MFIYISHDPENDEHLYACVTARNRLEELGHSTISANNLSDVGLIFRMEILRRADALYVIQESESENVCEMSFEDIVFCKLKEIPIYYHKDTLGNVPLMLTESRCPTQVRAFMDVVMKMYRIHLKKNADYSPANILGTGSVGVVVRMWDKMARIMNLVGFNISLKETARYDPKKQISASNEPLEDSFWDMSVYSIISILLDQDAWGK